MTPLHLAASLGRIKMIEDLVDAGAELDALDEINMTPLDRAKLY